MSTTNATPCPLCGQPYHLRPAHGLEGELAGLRGEHETLVAERDSAREALREIQDISRVEDARNIAFSILQELTALKEKP